MKHLETELKSQVGINNVAQVLLDIMQLTSLEFHQVVIVSFKNGILTLADETKIVKLLVRKGISEIIKDNIEPNIEDSIKKRAIIQTHQAYHPGEDSIPVFRSKRSVIFKSSRKKGANSGVDSIDQKGKVRFVVIEGGKESA